MPKKCSVGYCNSNYDSASNEYISISSFPTDSEEANTWLAKLPNVIDVSVKCLYYVNYILIASNLFI